MKTPICDFVRRYADSGAVRLHMPGHKGVGETEKFDITEIKGADSLYEAEGIIAESEANASELFGCNTLYSTEGSSQCIRAMLFIAVQSAKERGKEATVIAGRNAHKTFLSAAALIGFETEWMYPREDMPYLSCDMDLKLLEEKLIETNACAVYITSPDYLGNTAYIKAIAHICNKYGAELLVDNAHGAYLKFLSPSVHPMDLGAHMCCDSAHKTLPVLTGGAYLHTDDKVSAEKAKNALALFGSTSPSYLILQSLDKANAYLASDYSHNLKKLCDRVEILKDKMISLGYELIGNEPIKLTFSTKSYGYYGFEVAEYLRERGIECEFSDPDYIVLMLSPQNSFDELKALEEAMESLAKRPAIKEKAPTVNKAERVMSVREAMFAVNETVSVRDSLGRVLASASVGCPPAVPIVVCGERIDESAVRCFEYYSVYECTVVK